MEKYLHGLNLAHTNAICKPYFTNQDLHRTELLDYSAQAFIAFLVTNIIKRTDSHCITKQEIIQELAIMKESSILTALQKQFIIEGSPPRSTSKRAKD